MYQYIDQDWVSRRNMLRLLSNIYSSDWCQTTYYLTPSSINSPEVLCGLKMRHNWNEEIDKTLHWIEKSDTGTVIFEGETRVILAIPPFPLRKDITTEGPDISPFMHLINISPLIGIVLVRLGAYAIGILHGDDLIASKVGSRFIKNQHRAGGSSQRRYERNRERLVNEMFQKVCKVLETIFLPYVGSLDYVFLGGEKYTLHSLINSCPYIKKLTPKTQKRILSVNRPNKKAIDSIAFEVWKSHIVTITTELEKKSATSRLNSTLPLKP